MLSNECCKQSSTENVNHCVNVTGNHFAPGDDVCCSRGDTITFKNNRKAPVYITFDEGDFIWLNGGFVTEIEVPAHGEQPVTVTVTVIGHGPRSSCGFEVPREDRSIRPDAVTGKIIINSNSQ